MHSHTSSTVDWRNIFSRHSPFSCRSTMKGLSIVESRALPELLRFEGFSSSFIFHSIFHFSFWSLLPIGRSPPSFCSPLFNCSSSFAPLDASSTANPPTAHYALTHIHASRVCHCSCLSCLSVSIFSYTFLSCCEYGATTYKIFLCIIQVWLTILQG